MVKQKRKYAKCPSCHTEKHRTEMQASLAVLEKLERERFKQYKELGLDTYNSFIDSSFDWACDACLESLKAILGNPVLQNYCRDPHIAYFDSRDVCRNCGVDFIFSKEEKRLWYEQLKFWIDATPINCPPCRKKLRQLKRENNTLSGILKKEEDDISSEELQSVIAIYQSGAKRTK